MWNGDPILIETDTHYISKRLREEKEKQTIRSSKARESAQARWNANAQTEHSERNANASAEHCPSSSSPTTPTNTTTPPTPSPKKKPARSIDAKLFDAFWEVYPKKVGEGAVKRELAKAMMKVENIDVILTAVKLQVDADKISNDQYTPNPANWLKDEHWNDEIEHTAKPSQPLTIEPEYDIARYKADLLKNNAAQVKWFRDNILPIMKERMNGRSYAEHIEQLLPVTWEGAYGRDQRILVLFTQFNYVASWVMEHYVKMFEDALEQIREQLEDDEKKRCPHTIRTTAEVPEEYRIRDSR